MDIYELLTDQQKEIFNKMQMMNESRGNRQCKMDGHGHITARDQ